MTKSELLPILRLVPKQQEVVWGGHLLHDRLGKPASTAKVGESWEIWEGDPLEGEAFAGRTLKQLVDEYPEAILGSIPVANGWERFPLLTKFIDANEPLSVQVHPDDNQARRLEHVPYGKTEAWHIIQATPDAWIIHGLSEAVSAKSMRERLEQGTADPLFRRVPVAAGQNVFVPAGTIHAIGPGILLHEVQQTSDTTYRLYDWNRQEHGSKRELHLEKGLEVSRLEPSEHPFVTPLEWLEQGVQVSLLLACRYFTLRQVMLPGRFELDTEGASFAILTALTGECTVEAAIQSESLTFGQSLLIPASTGKYAIESTKAALILIESITGSPRLSLTERGIPERDVDRFLAQFGAAGW